MTRRVFDRQITRLVEDMTALGGDVDGQLDRTITVLKTLDLELAHEVVEGDGEINAEEHRIEQLCMNLIALQQPIASDLRMIAACLKILTDMERVGDQCADICEILAMSGVNANSLSLTHVVRMLEAARDMFRKALDAFLSRDAESARAVCKSDDEVDAMFSRVVLEVCGTIAENPANVMCDVDVIFITKYIERIGDHATNIAEWVIYMETGEHPDLNASQNAVMGLME